MSLLKKVRIGSIETENNVFVAPMAGITDSSYRILCRKFGAGLTFTEMVSSYAVIYSNKQTEEICIISEEERPVGLQLFGAVPEIMKKAVEIIVEKYNPDLIDINAGCPVPKVMKSGAGAKLLENPKLIFRIVKEISSIASRPVTIKMRLGLKDSSINIIENCLAAEEAGASMITIHPRTASGRFSSPCMWEYIALAKEKVKIPVCGNGDIKNPEDAVKMITETGCDAVMVGRATIGNPWIISGIISALKAYPEPFKIEHISTEEKIQTAIEHLTMTCRFKGELKGIREMRKILPHYIKGMPGSAKLRDRLVRIDNLNELIDLLRGITQQKKGET